LDLRVIGGRYMVAVPEPARFRVSQASQAAPDLIGVLGAGAADDSMVFQSKSCSQGRLRRNVFFDIDGDCPDALGIASVPRARDGTGGNNRAGLAGGIKEA
jgi:hypothetical protein